MPSFVPCKKNDANGFTCYVSLVSQANTKIMQANPTLAAGDAKIAIDDGAPANLGTLPAVDADFTKRVKVVLSQAETNGDNLSIIFSDAAGAEWCDLTLNIQTAAQTFDETDAVADAILVDTAEIGAAGAGLTAINLPNQTMDIVGNITGNLSGSVGSVTGAVGSVTGAVGSVTGNVGGNVVGSVGSVTGLTAANLDATVSSRATPAQVNAEVVDALNVDTYAEPAQGTPPATASLATKQNYMYKAWRNKKTQTATQWNLFNDDAATIDHKATVSDDGTTATKGEIATGP